MSDNVLAKRIVVGAMSILTIAFVVVLLEPAQESFAFEDSPMVAPKSVEKPVIQKIQKAAPFEECGSELGLHVFSRNGSQGKFLLPELYTGGAALLDYDSDGDLDLYLTQGASIMGVRKKQAGAGNQLFVNDAGGFADVSHYAGASDTSCSFGACVGDVNQDGYPDLYVTNYGENSLYLNRGDGRFFKAYQAGGAAGSDWSLGAVFLDYDQDGFLDLYVCNYVAYDPSKRSRSYVDGQEVYEDARDFEAQQDRLYKGDGNGHFRDVSREMGIDLVTPGRSVSVAVTDFDDDGDSDLYVSNDGGPNRLWVNQGPKASRRFVEKSAYYGATGVKEFGYTRSKGVVLNDTNRDGRPDIVAANSSGELHCVFRNEEGFALQDVSLQCGIALKGHRPTAFGVVAFDYDQDGFQDLFFANGELGPEQKSAAEQLQLFKNLDGKFAAQAPLNQSILQTNARAVLKGDLDNDGDQDLLVVQQQSNLLVLRNQLGPKQHTIGLEVLTSKGKSAAAYGAQVKIYSIGQARYLPQRYEVQSCGSYLASHDPRLLIPLPAEGEYRVDIRWPSKKEWKSFKLESGRYYQLHPSDGVIHRNTFRQQQ